MTKKISQLPAATSVDTDDEFVINQDGTTKKLTTANQWDFDNVNIDGGTIDGTAVNATTLTASGDVNFDSGTLFVDASLGKVEVSRLEVTTDQTTLPFQISQISPISSSDAGGGRGVFLSSAGNSTNNTGQILNAISFSGQGTGRRRAMIANLQSGGTTTGGHIAFYNSATATGTDAVTERMRIDSSGNVGIGTTSPSELLSVFGAHPATFGGTGQDSNVYIQSGFSQGVKFVTRLRSDFFGAFSISTGTVSLSTQNNAFTPTERMRIDSSGNVLIGTTVNTGVGWSFNPGNAPGAILNKSFSGLVDAFRFRHNGSGVGGIQYNNTTTSFNTGSDYRLKENIQPLTGALDKVQAMNPVAYDWKVGGEGEGFIAHELQEIAPYAVSGEKDGEDMQGVDYGKLTTLLVGAVKELTAKVEQLEAQLGANNGN